MEERRKALFKFLKEDNDECKLKDIKNTYDNMFDTPYGEYVVLTDNEADEQHRDSLESLIDDIGIIDVFGYDTWQWNYIVDNFLKDNGIEDIMFEDYKSYYNDIEYEGDEIFDNRQIKEITEMLANNDIISFDLEDIVKYLEIKDKSLCEILEDEELDGDMLEIYISIKEYFDNYDDNKDEYIEKCTEIIISEYDSPAEWVMLNFGKDILKKFIEDNQFSLDIDGISQWIIDTDGRGNSLASYDGKEYEEGDYFIYRIG